jgi:alkylation response protein AidB-like acyl-CoA dehydrogenase
VDFELSDDQLALQRAARDLLDRHAGSTSVRAHMASGEHYDVKAWGAMVNQGWLGVVVPETDGGLGLGWVEAAVLAEEIGSHVAPVPFSPSILALDALRRAGAQPWVEELLHGEILGCVAWSRRPGAVTAGADDTLTGRTDPVVGAAFADVVVVPVDDALYVVDLRATGRPNREPAVDQTRSLAWIHFDRTPAQRIGCGRDVEALVDRGVVVAAAEMLGGSTFVLAMTAQYAKDRVQFGQPIGSFQAVKHRCADMVVDVEGMRSTTWYAAWSLDAHEPGDPEASADASTAKVWCSDAAKRVMASALQVHGGIGFTWEHDLHLYLKRSQLDQLSFGDASVHRERLATLLKDRVRAGRNVL